ncbi:MAG: ABC transporter ATP-binding protein [Deltaproteobacteria bacterium]|nr:ABC transporter ATP-binding protein [Deltaproteobacteria bacterium]MBW1921619.1 ABC transporter ATP-binding protein [Deltaproteobacteria bacterium]MBW2045897.1 ABC transporter ATP-binding protein [Deltaproteobacteria bacterium]RLB34521.1 MAG: branched-chain amino acid ABC transporter ATP-binding protein [Deltaproteobacteria bacterium]
MLPGSGGRVVPDEIALKVSNLDVHYKDFQALWKVFLEAQKGEIVSVIGANGAGKSTLLNTIAGLLAPTQGAIECLGEKIDGLPPYKIVPIGITLVPEGRRIFPRLTVYENLIMGSYTPRTRSSRNEALKKIYQLFPVLKDRHNQMGDTLSGGEQQMLAIGRALMSNPKLILCDEISLGLAPVVIKSIYGRLRQINQEGITIVLVEQDIKRSLKVANRAYIMLEGKMVLEGEPSSISEEQVRKAYFGI